MGVVVLAAGVAAWLAPFREDSLVHVDRLTCLVVAVGAAVFAGGLERLQTWLVQRPQPFASPSLVAADDPIRSQSVHSLAGSGLAVLLLVVSVLSYTLAGSDVQVLRWTMWEPAIGGFLLALVACLYYGHRAWRVRRSVTIPIAPA